MKQEEEREEEEDEGEQRETIAITQTDENFEIEYTVSNSCTPDSKQSNTNIKRRINFDDTSGG